MSDEIDELLNEIVEVDNKKDSKEETKDLTIVKFGDKEVSIEDEDAMMASIFSSALEDKKKADELYEYYVSRIEMDRDRSDSVREGLAKSVELRQNVTSNLIKLLDIKKKYSLKNSGNSIVNLQLSPRETQIDINKLSDEILNS